MRGLQLSTCTDGFLVKYLSPFRSECKMLFRAGLYADTIYFYLCDYLVVLAPLPQNIDDAFAFADISGCACESSVN